MGRALAPVALALAGLLLAASCGDAGASKVVPVQDLAAEVCTDREGRDASLYVRNLGDTSWSSPAISVTKSGREYELGLDPRSKQQYEEILADWPPESVDPTDPLDTPRHFVFKGRVERPEGPNVRPGTGAADQLHPPGEREGGGHHALSGRVGRVRSAPAARAVEAAS